MSEMVERGAAVIAAELMELTADQRRSFRFPEDANGDTCDRARGTARAFFAAIREPTEEMVKAGAETIDPKLSDSEAFAQIRYIWPDMIDEALKD